MHIADGGIILGSPHYFLPAAPAHSHHVTREKKITGTSQTELCARVSREAPTEANLDALQWDCRVHVFHTRAKKELCQFHTVLRWQVLSKYVRNNARVGWLVSQQAPPSFPSKLCSCTTTTQHHMEDCCCRQPDTAWKKKKKRLAHAPYHATITLRVEMLQRWGSPVSVWVFIDCLNIVCFWLYGAMRKGQLCWRFYNKSSLFKKLKVVLYIFYGNPSVHTGFKLEDLREHEPKTEFTSIKII